MRNPTMADFRAEPENIITSKNKKPRGTIKSTRGIIQLILASTNRMDASKAKKEASEIKIPFCDVNYFHAKVPIDN